MVSGVRHRIYFPMHGFFDYITLKIHQMWEKWIPVVDQDILFYPIHGIFDFIRLKFIRYVIGEIRSGTNIMLTNWCQPNSKFWIVYEIMQHLNKDSYKKRDFRGNDLRWVEQCLPSTCVYQLGLCLWAAANTTVWGVDGECYSSDRLKAMTKANIALIKYHKSTAKCPLACIWIINMNLSAAISASNKEQMHAFRQQKARRKWLI